MQVVLSQERLAAKAGLSREYVSILENGKRSPTVGALTKQCRVMGIWVWKLIRRAEEAK
jgi:transcriptional regulator with XRE-family HTH domain